MPAVNLVSNPFTALNAQIQDQQQWQTNLLQVTAVIRVLVRVLGLGLGLGHVSGETAAGNFWGSDPPAPSLEDDVRYAGNPTAT